VQINLALFNFDVPFLCFDVLLYVRGYFFLFLFGGFVMVVLHVVGEAGVDFAHHVIVFGAGVVVGVSLAAVRVFSRGK